MEFDAKTVKTLAEAHDLALVVLFGSHATGKTHRLSDVDIGFIAKRPKNVDEVARMHLSFSETLKVKHLDLVDFHRASPLFLKHALHNAHLLYESAPSTFARFKMYATKLYFEAKPLYRIREASLSRYLQTI